MTKWSYYVPGDGETPENAVEYSPGPGFEGCSAAKHYHNECGSDADNPDCWPIKFVVLKDGKEYARFTVAMEYIERYWVTESGYSKDQDARAGGLTEEPCS